MKIIDELKEDIEKYVIDCKESQEMVVSRDIINSCIDAWEDTKLVELRDILIDVIIEHCRENVPIQKVDRCIKEIKRVFEDGS